MKIEREIKRKNYRLTGVKWDWSPVFKLQEGKGGKTRDSFGRRKEKKSLIFLSNIEI